MFKLDFQISPPAQLNSTYIEQQDNNVSRDISGRFQPKIFKTSLLNVSVDSKPGRPIDNMKIFEFEQLCQMQKKQIDLS